MWGRMELILGLTFYRASRSAIILSARQKTRNFQKLAPTPRYFMRAAYSPAAFLHPIDPLHENYYHLMNLPGVLRP